MKYQSRGFQLSLVSNLW